MHARLAEQEAYAGIPPSRTRRASCAGTEAEAEGLVSIMRRCIDRTSAECRIPMKVDEKTLG